MKTKSGNILAVLSMVGLLVSMSSLSTAAEPTDTPEIRAAVENAATRSDHLTIAKYYEDAATQMREKVKEQEELLEQYESKSYLYGRQAQDLQSHTAALIRHHEQTVTADIQAAALHRQIASKLDESHASSGTQSPSM